MPWTEMEALIEPVYPKPGKGRQPYPLAQYRDLKVDGKQAVVRNGYLPERTIQTGLGDIPVKVPKVRDRSGEGIRFNSRLVPPYLKRTKAMEELIPWLYPKGI